MPAPTSDAAAVKILNRADLTKQLVAKLAHEEAVIAGIGNTNFDLYAAGHRAQNFYMLGSMGLACPIALGVAIAQPERGVIALEGDGSILMSLGCLATIAMVKPRNLTIIIMDNGVYQITGKQASATASSTDIVGVARGAGIANSHWVRDENHFNAAHVAPVRSGRAGAARSEDRRCARRRSDRARSAAHPAQLHAWARDRPGQRDGRLTRKHVVRRRSGKFATWRRKSRTSIQLRKSRGLAVCADGEAKVASIASATGIAWGHVAEPGLNCCGPTFALSGGCNEKIHSERVISGGVCSRGGEFFCTGAGRAGGAGREKHQG